MVFPTQIFRKLLIGLLTTVKPPALRGRYDRLQRPCKARPSTANGRRDPPAPTRPASSATPNAALTPMALINLPIALPRRAGGKTSATVAMVLGGTSAPPNPVSKRHVRRAP